MASVPLRRHVAAAVLLLLPLSACTTTGSGPAAPAPAEAGVVAVVHKSATCSCCHRHEAHLRSAGYQVQVVTYHDAEELSALKDRLGVPGAQRSCHTTVVDGYVVEGHMPAEEIDRLLRERPDVDGIALAGMPAGAPGMPGIKAGPWTIWNLQDGVAAPGHVR